jgi:hypothetical protein
MSDIRPENQPDIRPVPAPLYKPTCYRLHKDYTFDLKTPKANQVRRITIPAGFTYDGSSEWVMSIFPGFLLWIFAIGQDGPHRAAALVHDYLYVEQLVPRKRADDIFYEMMVAAKVPKWRAGVRWLAVRALGWVVY